VADGAEATGHDTFDHPRPHRRPVRDQHRAGHRDDVFRRRPTGSPNPPRASASRCAAPPGCRRGRGRRREATANVDRLRDSSARDRNVVNLIAQIARQTTLLALNSTIEAGAAGAPARLSVVATEVKALAVQTQSATEEITKKIEALQKDATGSADAVHRISQAIEAIRPVFENVNGAVAEQNHITGEMGQERGIRLHFIVSVGDSAGEIDSATRQAEAHGDSVAKAGKAVTAFARS